MTYNIKLVSGVCVCVCVCVCAQLLSCIRVFVTPWMVACQVPRSMGLSWQEYWSGLPFPPPFFFFFWLHQVWVAACRIFLVATSGILSWGLRTLSCSMWDPIPWAGTKPRPSALGAWSLSCWMTRKVPVLHFVYIPHIQATHRATQDKAWLLPRPSCVLSHIWLFSTPWTVAHQAWDSPVKNTRVGCHFLLQGIFPTQQLNPSLLHCNQMLYHWATREAPWLLNWA